MSLQFKILFLFLLILLPVVNIFSQDSIDLDLLSSQEEFKWGVKAYHRGLFNESARNFEKALSYKPENVDTKKWLGLAWYRSGFTDFAINEWESIQKAGKADSLLLNRLEILKQQTGISEPNKENERYLPAMELEGKQEEYTLFLRPASVIPDRNGGFFISSYGTNEVLRFNSNGAVTNRLNGGIEGYNHPFDLEIAPNGFLYVCEFNGDRICRSNLEGRDIIKFGESGRGDGQFLGPQYIAVDEKNFLYITDSGNRRVVKLDENGKFILSFGQKKGSFDGFQMPTGIESLNGNIYVADGKKGDISIFDYSGNFISRITSKNLNYPEGLSVVNDSNILIADSGRVLSYDIDEGTIRLVSDMDGRGRRITKAAVDLNGNLLTADFDLNRIAVSTELSNMYSGLFVQIDKINSNSYPQITADLRITDREGKPFVGLAPNNFVVTEKGYPVQDTSLVYVGNTDKHLNAVVLLDGAAEMRDFKTDMVKAVKSLMDSSSGKATLKLVSAGANPVTEAELNEGSRQFMAAANRDFFSPDAKFDIGLRHAASELLSLRGRRCVIFITNGEEAHLSYNDYHPVELASFLKNNGISFYCVTLTEGNSLSEELRYICEETNGDEIYLYQPEGLGHLFDRISVKADGSYTLVYTSIDRNYTQDDFIPIEIEAFLYNRSGRESSGYFKPGNFR
ncbi:MAG: hypothetical protein PQJ46_14995 [Spirochaetales bacterium]|nr:hypothetical protein [Spirochaetales bacterium]